MPEEKKKDSFTFSDKIKSGKQTSSKSFANRISSKIGSDGKPRQTLFERTKRDAPFFIAALVALLLLPFLYKYSGQVTEEPSMITPGYEDAMVNPDRSGFDFTGDPDGQIAQLAGRDSLDLIVGFGKKGEEEEGTDESLGDIYRSGLADTSSAYSRNATEEEVNNTNIYKYRKDAAPQTRAAFRRAATKINSLRRDGLTGRSGGKGITPWGGSMKTAASKVRGPGMRNSTKPVSLQPLQAAGKPSRVAFGQGAAAEARRSKDAMSKSSAMQALMDAQMRPVEPGRIGGLSSGDYGGPGGGLGSLARNFTYNGKEPWWWDMMKRRAQMEWEAKFNYRWGWINWATGLVQNWLAGLLNCLAVGDSGGDIDNFLGSGGGSGSNKVMCCGKEKDSIGAVIKQQTGLDFSKEGCKNYQTLVGKDACPDGWVDKRSGGERINGWQARKKCLGGKVKGTSLEGSLSENSQCRNLVNKHYRVTPQGAARNWHTYIYIVARNYAPEALYKGGNLKGQGAQLLCTKSSDDLRIGSKHVSGAGLTSLPTAFDGTSSTVSKRFKKDDRTVKKNAKGSFDYQRSAKGEKENSGSIENSRVEKDTEWDIDPDMYAVDQEGLLDACVVYMQVGDELSWENFRGSMLETLQNIAERNGVAEPETAAHNAFNQLDLMYVTAFSSKQKIAYGSNLVRDLPMEYWRFRDAYIIHRGTAASGLKNNDDMKIGDTATPGSKTFKNRLNVDKRKYRDEDKYVESDDKCWFDPRVSIACADETGELGQAEVTFKQNYKGKKDPSVTQDSKEESIRVDVTYVPAEGAGGKTQTVSKFTTPKTNQRLYTFKAFGPQEESYGSLRWTLYRGSQVADTAECDFHKKGSVTPELKPEECKDGDEITIGGAGEDGICQLTLKCKKGPDGKMFYDKTKPEKNMKDPDCQKNNEEITTYICECEEGKSQRFPYKEDCEIEVICKDKGWDIHTVGSGCNSEPSETVPVKAGYYLHTDIKMIPTQADPFYLKTRPDQDVPVKQKENARWGSCKLTVDNAKLIQLDQQTLDYVNRAKTKFEKKYEGKATLLYDEKEGADLTVSQLIDVINMDPDDGTVPANAVCVLGKTISANAPDPAVYGNGKEFEDEMAESDFGNVLGTFLAFIGPESAFYPGKYTKSNKTQKPVWDERFKCNLQTYADNAGVLHFKWPECKNDRKNLRDTDPSCHYCWGGYFVGKGSAKNITEYENQLKTSGVWVQGGHYPLEGLKPQGVTFNLATESFNTIRDRYEAKYKYLYTSSLECKYPRTQTLTQADVMKYITTLCEKGQYIKPEAPYYSVLEAEGKVDSSGSAEKARGQSAQRSRS